MTTMLDEISMLDQEPIRRDDDEDAGFGGLKTAQGGLPLCRLAVAGRITGLLYRLTVTQDFVNVHAEPLEATYIFPLPARAGVTRFRLQVGERVIDGVLKERGAARVEYDQAIQQGHRAAIAEEERPEVFTMRVGNIPPGEAVTVELELVGPLAVTDGEATFRFPLVVAPRYIPGAPLDSPAVGLGAALDTDAVPDASRISPPVLLPGQPNPVHLRFRLELDPAGLPLSDLRASLHTLHLSQTGSGLRVIELTPGAERLDRDVILRFRVGEEQIRSGLSVYRNADGKTTALLTVVPPVALPASVRPRDVVVVLDRSGSMDGWKMVAARRAAGRIIDTLTERDRFGVILFDDRLEEPAPSAGQLIVATDRCRFRAVEFLAKVEARGGTEISPALKRALAYFPNPPDPDRERIVLFVTDGQVGNEDQLLRQVEQAAQGCRIFAVGIDRAVNVSLLERLAGYGGGHFDLVESEDRLDEVLCAVHRRLGAPVLTDVRLEPALREMAPESVDLFPGVPLRLGGQWPDSSPAQVTMTGRTADGAMFRQILTPLETTDSAVQTLWARARVLDLEHEFAAGRRDPGLSDAITSFSLKYGVLCRFTAFVAVDRSEVVNPGGEVQQIVQPVELPSQWATPMMAGVVACAPCAPPPSMRMSTVARRMMAASHRFIADAAEGDMDCLDIPAFLRRETSDAPREPASVYEAAPTSPKPLPPWFERLETLAKASVLDTAELLAAMQEALTALAAMGKSAAKLIKAGQDVVRLLGEGSNDAPSWLKTWLARVKDYLEGESGGKPRWAWWR